MITIAQITMNAGDGISGSTIKWNIINNRKNFDRFIVVDGAITEEAKKFYNEHNVEYIDSPWNDSYVDQYKAFSSVLKDEEWCLYLDCDEVPSSELVGYINGEKFKHLQLSNVNMVLLPCVLHITDDSKNYYPCENAPKKEYAGQWVKKILFKKQPSLDFSYAGSHVIPTHKSNEKHIYIPFPYYHMKTLESFVENDVWQAFLSPEGQQYDPSSAMMFRLLKRPYKSTKEFKQATKNGEWSPALINFALKNIYRYENPISRLGWTYFILNGHKSNSDEIIPTWEKIKDHILSKECMEIFDKNKKMNNFIKIKD